MINRITLLLFIGLAWGQSTTIAVFDLENNGLKDSEVRILSDRLQSELVKVGGYTVVERKKIEKVFEEQKFQMSGCVEECLIEIGMLLGAKEIVIGSVGRFGSTYTISARLVNATTGEMIRSSDFDSEGDISILLKSGMFRVASELTGRALPPQLTGKIANKNIIGRGKGIIYITSYPSSADVWVDGYKVEGKTPMTISDLGEGSHTLQLIKNDYELTKTVSVKADQINKVDVVLELSKENLNVFSTPDGASVSIDGISIRGVTPLTVKGLSVGQHKVIIAKDGYEHNEAQINIEKNKTNRYTGNLIEIGPGTIIVDAKYPSGTVVKLYEKSGSKGWTEHSSGNASDNINWKVKPQTYELIIRCPGYLTLKRDIQVIGNGEITISDPLESNEWVLKEIKSLKMKRNLSFVLAGVIAGTGGYLLSLANKQYTDYQVAGSNAGELRDKVETNDFLGTGFFGVGGVSLSVPLHYHSKIGTLTKMLSD
jgi:TolB-like protein